jgi:hypothetical protein
LPDIWVSSHPEHFLWHIRDHAGATASVRHRRRARPYALQSPLSHGLPSMYD